MGYILSVLLSKFISLLETLIFIYVLSSWFADFRNHWIIKSIGKIVNPILYPCYKLQNKVFPNLPVDLSPMIAFLILEFIRRFI